MTSDSPPRPVLEETAGRSRPAAPRGRRRTARPSRIGAVAALVVLGLVAAGCGSGGGDQSSPTVVPEVRTPTTAAADDATTPPSVPGTESLDGVAVAYQPVVTLDDTPMAMAVRPGDDEHVYVAQRSGTLVRLDPSAGPDAPTDTVLDFHDDVSTDGERGFLGVAFSPDGDRLYVSYTNPAGDTRIDEYQMTGQGAAATVDTGSRRQVLAQDQPFSNHNGGNIAFGPDGYLYFGLGDGGSAGDPDHRGQDPTDLLGKVLRIDPTEGATPYGVPEDNPDADGADGRPEIWITGVRNPWRWSFDSLTGDLWIGDVGQDEVEEVDFLPADAEGLNAGRGANLGWSLMEGDQPFNGGAPPSGYVPPITTYLHADGGCSITGGYVYRGTAMPDLAGAYLYSDLCLSHLQGMLVDGSRVIRDQADLGALPDTGPISFGQDAAGELYVLLQSGQVSKLVPG